MVNLNNSILDENNPSCYQKINLYVKLYEFDDAKDKFGLIDEASYNKECERLARDIGIFLDKEASTYNTDFDKILMQGLPDDNKYDGIIKHEDIEEFDYNWLFILSVELSIPFKSTPASPAWYEPGIGGEPAYPGDFEWITDGIFFKQPRITVSELEVMILKLFQELFSNAKYIEKLRLTADNEVFDME